MQPGSGKRYRCDARCHPIGMGQVLDRGLAPRLSIGTLQLSIRCSSFHFGPSRSFPVSVAGKVAAFGVGWDGREMS